MARRSKQPTWPLNQWPAVMFHQWVDETAKAQQAEATVNGTTLPIGDIRATILRAWVEMMYPAATA